LFSRLVASRSDEITEAVTIAIAPAIAGAEQQRLRKPPGSLDAWAAYQRGLWHLSKFTADDNAIAQKFFQHDFRMTAEQPPLYRRHRLLGISPGTVSVLLWWKVGFKGRDQPF
jgi:hypothetical protein